jgi:hypothetical protein
LSENLKRDHIHPLALNAAHTIALAKLQGNLEIGKSASIELALNRGLYDLGVLSLEDYQFFDARYRRPLREIIAENQVKRENSHIPKLELMKQKQAEIQAGFLKVKQEIKLEGAAAPLKGMWEQWEAHRDLAWRIRTITYAKKYPENEFAKLIIEKEKECDIISQGEGS